MKICLKTYSLWWICMDATGKASCSVACRYNIKALLLYMAGKEDTAIAAGGIFFSAHRLLDACKFPWQRGCYFMPRFTPRLKTSSSTEQPNSYSFFACLYFRKQNVIDFFSCLTLPYVALRCFTLLYVTLRCFTLSYAALRYVTLTLRYAMFCYVCFQLRFTKLQNLESRATRYTWYRVQGSVRYISCPLQHAWINIVNLIVFDKNDIIAGNLVLSAIFYTLLLYIFLTYMILYFVYKCCYGVYPEFITKEKYYYW